MQSAAAITDTRTIKPGSCKSLILSITHPERMDRRKPQTARVIEMAGAISVPLKSHEQSRSYARASRRGGCVQSSFYNRFIIPINGLVSLICLGWGPTNRGGAW